MDKRSGENGDPMMPENGERMADAGERMADAGERMADAGEQDWDDMDYFMKPPDSSGGI